MIDLSLLFTFGRANQIFVVKVLNWMQPVLAATNLKGVICRKMYQKKTRLGIAMYDCQKAQSNFWCFQFTVYILT
jgi:hypothetical protein